LPKAARGSRQILTAEEMDRILEEMAAAIYGQALDKDTLVLVGIRTGGVYLANRLRDKIKKMTGHEIPVGILDIGLYRDDWTRISPQPIVRTTEIPFPIDDRDVVLVDDVLFTGRTVRSAMDALIDFGRPKRIVLAVMVDRGHRELPICADYAGVKVATTLDEVVNVYVRETGGEDRVVVESNKSA
jgi:pyrimidine operon attenuation protein/uracil phosphoribosyltransferase